MASAGFVFSLTVLLISLLLIALVISNIVVYNQFKNGSVLTINQVNTFIAVNAIALILLLVVFIYSIFATINSRKGGDETEEPEVPKEIAPLPVANLSPTPITPINTNVTLSRPTQVVETNIPIPPNTVMVGPAPVGVTLYKVEAPTTVNPGTYLCSPP